MTAARLDRPLSRPAPVVNGVAACPILKWELAYDAPQQ